MPISRTRRRRGTEAGFSAVELLVAVTVLALVVGLVVISTRPSDRARLNATANGLALFLSEVRLDAAQGARTVAVAYDPDARRFRAGSRAFEVPDRVGISFGGEAEAMRLAIRPSGESAGARVRLELGEARADVRLDWLTGRVEVIR